MSSPESVSAERTCRLLLALGGLMSFANCTHDPKSADADQVAREMGARSALIIVRTSELGADWRVTGATYTIDGRQFWQESDRAGLPREAPVFDGRLIDGEHTLKVAFVGERGAGGNMWDLSETVTFIASPTTATTIEIVTHEGTTHEASAGNGVKVRFNVRRANGSTSLPGGNGSAAKPTGAARAACGSSSEVQKEAHEVWPETVAQAAAAIITVLSAEDQEVVRNTPRDDLIRFHHGWGTGIRNGLGLWRGNDALLADCGCVHPDDCSMLIIEAVWGRLQTQ